MKKSILVIAISVLSMNSYSQEIKEKPVEKLFKNTDCELTDSCDLKEFRLQTYDYKTRGKDTSYGTNAFMSYTTDKVENLEKYAIVQQIRGCQFYSNLDSDGNVIKIYGVGRDFFGKGIKFRHPNWVIDSLDADPLYNSGEAEARHAYHRWNAKVGSFAEKTESYYFKKSPTNPTLYVSDLPGTALYKNGHAKNISLEFKTCIYKTEDVPLVAQPEDINFAEPIACHSWKSSFLFNHKLKKFESRDEIDEVCLAPLEN